MQNPLKNLGPGTLVAAAFIGPGTVTVCSAAGINFGFSLLWAMLLAIVATIVLQEMAARLGIITQLGLSDVIKKNIQSKNLRTTVLIITLLAIVVGNAAYEGGNIGGASLGLEAMLGQPAWGYYPLIAGVIVFFLLYLGSYKVLERSLIALVILMSLSFLMAAIITKPNLGELFKGIFTPTLPTGSLLTVIGLIGTTVVPYNLFLHASLVKERWKDANGLTSARVDTFVSITLGGLVSMAIIVAAASANSGSLANVLDLAKTLEPVYGSMARYFLGVGMFAAGITSAITAPLAAAYVANGCFGWQAGLKDWRFRLVWMFIVFLGVFLLTLDIKPIEVIQLAQIANGLLLPLISVLLLWMVNKAKVMGTFKNNLFQNVLAGLIIIITIFLGLRSIIKVFE